METPVEPFPVKFSLTVLVYLGVSASFWSTSGLPALNKCNRARSCGNYIESCCAKGSHFAFYSGTAVSDHFGFLWDQLTLLAQPHRLLVPTRAPLQPYISIVQLWPYASTISLIGTNVNSQGWRGQKVNCQLKFCTEGLVLLLPNLLSKEVALEEPSLCKRTHAAKNQDGRDLLLAADKLCSSQTLQIL